MVFVSRAVEVNAGSIDASNRYPYDLPFFDESFVEPLIQVWGLWWSAHGQEDFESTLGKCRRTVHHSPDSNHALWRYFGCDGEDLGPAPVNQERAAFHWTFHRLLGSDHNLKSSPRRNC